MEAKKTYQDVLDWAQSPVDDKPAHSPLYHYSLREQPKAFAALLRHYLREADYDIDASSLPETLAQTIGSRQEPERELPYHTSLMEDWLSGKQLINAEALSGITYYLEASGKIPPHIPTLLTAAQAHIENDITAKNHHAMKERTQTASAIADRSGLTQTDIANQGSVKPNCISKILSGDSPLTPYNLAILQRGLPAASAAELWQHYWAIGHHETCQTVRSDKTTYGAKLRAIREYQELTQAQLGERIGLDASTIAHWERRALHKTSDHAFCPTAEITPTLLNALKGIDEALSERCGEAYKPIMSPEISESLQSSIHITRGDRRTSTTFTPELLAEIALLREDTCLTYQAISELLERESPHSVSVTYRKRYGGGSIQLTPEEREAAQSRLRDKGIDVDALAVKHPKVTPSPWRGRDDSPTTPPSAASTRAR